MKVLVIGGTQFIGRHVVEKLVFAGHDVTLLNRGKTAPTLFPNIPTIKANRETDDFERIEDLKKNWDGVIDLCAYYPKDVTRLLDFLKGRAGRYIVCSSVSAYSASSMDKFTPLIDENSPLHPCSPQEAVDSTMSTYGQRKAECERVALKQHQNGVPVIIIRPSIVYGQYDHTDRFAYWIWRASQAKPFILPDYGLTITRRTYAPDLATAFVASITSTVALGNAYNIAETAALNFRDTLLLVGDHLGVRPLEHAVSIPSDWLIKEGVKPWTDFPLWIPKTNLLIDTYRSRRDLSFVSTPPEQALPAAAEAFLKEKKEPKAGLSMSAEGELLKKWKKYSAS
jgi:2'-hydroxyisoflavone reductase